MKKQIIFLFLIALTNIGESQTTQEKGSLVDFLEKRVRVLEILSNEFQRIIDDLVIEHQKCVSFNKEFSWTIEIVKVGNDNGADILGISISRNMFKNASLIGYGHFFYKGFLFNIRGIEAPDIFKPSNCYKRLNVYEKEPPMIFDPPEWFFYYINGEFFLMHKKPC